MIARPGLLQGAGQVVSGAGPHERNAAPDGGTLDALSLVARDRQASPAAPIHREPDQRRWPVRSPEWQACGIDRVLDGRAVEAHGELAGRRAAETQHIAAGLGDQRRQTLQVRGIAAARGADQDVAHRLAKCRLLGGLALAGDRHGHRVHVAKGRRAGQWREYRDGDCSEPASRPFHHYNSTLPGIRASPAAPDPDR